MATDLGICNTALYLVGADEIESFSDDSREAKICSHIYETTKNALLQTHFWNFSLAMAELAGTALASTDAEYKFGFTYRYQLPIDYLRMVRKNIPTNDYTISQDKLYTNDTPVEVLYQYRVSETEFPEYFTRALEFEMARLLAAALIQDETQVQIWTTIAGDTLRKAKLVDSQSAPPAEIDPTNYVLTSIR